ncbi:MAG: HEPN domain-containing protein [Gemmatimonadetes bacterium]|nr:HEPN domain-containing protein [Gemmatimonadota bacterium]
MLHDPARVEDTRAWLEKARLDLEAGTFELANSALFGDVVFHAQQAAEKSFKAFLAWHDVPFRKTHDLGAIGGACLEIDTSLRQVADRAAPLTPYAWKFRYPGESAAPSREEAETAMATARDVYNAIVARLPVEARP